MLSSRCERNYTYLGQGSLSPQTINKLADAVQPATQTSQHFELVSGSVHDGDTFRVSDGDRQIKVRLCGIDAPELEQDSGVASRDHLRTLIAKGSGHVTLVTVETDQYGRTIADVFVPTGNGEEEIHLNSRMVRDGMAYVYPQYVSGCPNATIIQNAEETARKNAAGVWKKSVSQKPWDYRRQHQGS
ncbi:MAG: thermonuclease family protein [Phormidesmis sp.]